MRRPHPQFDTARDAWVTRAGGRLKLLAKGPKKRRHRVAAWAAFYAHMNQLGNPVHSAPAAISVGQLADEYAPWLQREVDAGRKALRQRYLPPH